MENLQTSSTGEAEECWKSFMCATRLHNFCSNEGGADNILTNSLSHDLTDSILATPSNDCPISVDNNSIMQEIIVQEISRTGLIRPAYNLQRNNT